MTDIALSEEQQEKVNQAEGFLYGAKLFKVHDMESFLSASKTLKEIKVKKNEFEAMRKELKAPILKAGKGIDDFFRKPIHFLTEAESEYKKSLRTYTETEEIRYRELEKERLLQMEDLSRQAIDALKKNNGKRYDEITVQMSQLTHGGEVAKAEGISFRDNWKGKVTDFNLLLRAIVDGKAPVGLISIDETALNKLASSIKDTMSYPGVEFYNDKTVAVRT